MLAFCSPDSSTLRQDAGADVEVADQPSEKTAVDLKKTLKLLGKGLNTLHRKIVKGGEQFEIPPDGRSASHPEAVEATALPVRIRRTLYRKVGCSTLHRHLTPAQDALREFNDKHVARTTYRERTTQDPRAWYAVGWFDATEEHDARARKAAIAETAGIKKFWKDAS